MKPTKNIGLGLLGEDAKKIKFIHKWFWTFKVDFVEEEIYLNSKMKVTSRPAEGEGTLTTILYDFSDVNNEIIRLCELWKSSHPERNKYGTGVLTIWLPDHTEFTEETCLSNVPMKPFEQWTLSDLELVDVNFSELDFTNSEPVTVEFTWRYSTAIYKNLCPPSSTELPEQDLTSHVTATPPKMCDNS